MQANIQGERKRECERCGMDGEVKVKVVSSLASQVEVEAGLEKANKRMTNNHTYKWTWR